MNLSKRYRKAKLAVFVGIFGNIFLGLFKLAAGILGNSSAVISDSFHSFSDSTTSIVVWIGMKVGKKKPDKYHPYGHGDAEPIAGLILSIILGIVGFELARNSFVMIVTGNISTPGIITIYATLLSIVVNYAMTSYTMKIGKEIKSLPLIADSYHHKSDYYTSVVVLVGVVGAIVGGEAFRILDPIAGILVALWIMKIGFDQGMKNMRSLMGETPSEGIFSEIKNVTSSVKGVKDVHDVKIHYVGPNASVTMHVNMDRGLKFSEVHKIATRIENEIKKKIDSISSVVVHPEPA